MGSQRVGHDLATEQQHADATGEDTDALHVNDKVGIDANAELTVS